MNIEFTIGMLMIIGILPWHMSYIAGRAERNRRSRYYRLEIKAALWQLRVERSATQEPAWTLTVPLVREVKSAILAAIRNIVF